MPFAVPFFNGTFAWSDAPLGRREVLMQHDQKQLHQIALEYPWWIFTGEEIAELCNVSVTVVSLVKREPDNPFRLNKCRPEWFAEWMRTHPSFQLDRTPRENLSKKIDPSFSKNIPTGRRSSKNIKGRSGRQKNM